MPRSADDFAAIQVVVESEVDPAARLPAWPFRRPAGALAVGQYSRLLGDGFVPVLEGLAAAHSDADITLVTVKPDPRYYQENYAYNPGFRITPAALADKYWTGISHEPGGDPTGAIVYTAEIVAMVGSTRTWAIWGQRDWDLVLVQASTPDERWLEAGVPFVDPREALEDFTAVERSAKPLTERETAVFLSNVDKHSSHRPPPEAH